MSEREQLVREFVEYIRKQGHFNAPYGILEGKAANGQYRTVTFGRSRTLDVELRVYGPQFILIRPSNSNTHIFKGPDAKAHAMLYIKQDL